MKRVAIVGGGIGGLATAIALRKVGFDVHVYERAHELTEVGSALSLWPTRSDLCRHSIRMSLGVCEATAIRFVAS